MPISSPESFVEFVRQQAGDTLRLVLFCTPENYRVGYVRDDVKGAYTGDQVDDLVAYLQEIMGPEMSAAILRTTGELESVVLTYESAVGVVLPATGGHVLVSLDPTAASQLHDFTESCQDFLSEV